MTVAGGDLRAVGQVVHRGQGVQKAPHARAQEGHHASAQRPQHGGFVRVLAAAFVDHIEGEQGHHEERNRLQRGEHRAPHLPVSRRANPEVMVAGADDAGDQRHGDDHIQPFFDDFTVHAGHFHQHEGQHGAHDQFPHAFHPQVNHPPPEVFIQHQVMRVIEREQKENRQPPQAQHHHQADAGLAALEHGHAQVEQERQRHQHDANLGDGRLFEKLAAHGG